MNELIFVTKKGMMLPRVAPMTFGRNVHFWQEPIMLQLFIEFAVDEIHLVPEVR
jgi:hypothetical protein